MNSNLSSAATAKLVREAKIERSQAVAAATRHFAQSLRALFKRGHVGKSQHI